MFMERGVLNQISSLGKEGEGGYGVGSISQLSLLKEVGSARGLGRDGEVSSRLNGFY